MKVLVTGASGFVGQALTAHLLDQGHEVVALVGARGAAASAGARPMLTQVQIDLLCTGDLRPLMQGVEAIVHLAGRAHVRRGGAEDRRAQFWPLNVDATRRLADAASNAGVRRIVFASSIGVLGDESVRPFTEEDAPNPHSHYAESKLAAEQVLSSLDLETVIVRPPLIVGPGAAGNLRLMIKLVRHGIPCPDIRPGNRRSLAGISNLVAFLERCVHDPRAANQLFLFADGPAISTADLIARLARARGKSAAFIPAPRRLVAQGAQLVGLGSALGAFWKTLEVSMERSERLLDWRQPFPLDLDIRRAAQFQATDG